MSATARSSSSGIRSLATLLICRYRLSSGNAAVAAPTAYQYSSGGNGMMFSKFGYGIGSLMHQGLSIQSGDPMAVGNKKPDTQTEEEENTVNVQHPDAASPSPRPSIFSWAKWLWVSILPLLFSLWKQNWGNMLKIEGKVEEVVEEVEEVAEVIEKVAATTEKISAEVAEKLGDGELKEAALKVEHIASVTAKDAKLTQDFIHKVGDVKQDLKDLETMVEPVIDRIEQGIHDKSKL